MLQATLSDLGHFLLNLTVRRSEYYPEKPVKKALETRKPPACAPQVMPRRPGVRATCGGDLRNILFNKQARIVLLVRVAAFRVYVYACANGDTFFQQAVSQSADATEHVNCGYRILGR
jgi:hypothetical protein